MQLSFIGRSFTKILLIIAPTLARHHRPRELMSQNCILDHTYGEIADPRAYLVTSQLNTTVSSGDLCCDLCARSTDNCLFSKYDPQTGNCALIVYEDFEELDDPANEGEEACSLGVLRGGIVVDKVFDWNHYWIGPCWYPADLSGGLEVPGQPPYPINTPDGKVPPGHRPEDLPENKGG